MTDQVGAHMPEPIYKAVERVLDECGAWIARPSDEVTRKVALAAGIAWSLHEQSIARAMAEELTRLRAQKTQLVETLTLAKFNMERSGAWFSVPVMNKISAAILAAEGK